MPFWLVLLTEHKVTTVYGIYLLSLLRDKRGLPLPAWLQDNSTRLVASVQQSVDASKFLTLVGQFTQEPLCTILL